MFEIMFLTIQLRTFDGINYSIVHISSGMGRSYQRKSHQRGIDRLLQVYQVLVSVF